MSEASGEPVDIWKRLKKLTTERKKVVERLRRVNESIAIRSGKLTELGEQYTKLTFAIEKLRDELSQEQLTLMVKLLEKLSVKVDSLTEDIGELSEPNILLFVELEEIEAEIAALQSIINAERPDPKGSS
ncbi:MAG: hypothetical protein H6677_17455 [Candidatus Obscuribacterales bacterium]|nr:hypothetical protein [Candidatus Obscuribacterales bacterium]